MNLFQKDTNGIHDREHCFRKLEKRKFFIQIFMVLLFFYYQPETFTSVWLTNNPIQIKA